MQILVRKEITHRVIGHFEHPLSPLYAWSLSGYSPALYTYDIHTRTAGVVWSGGWMRINSSFASQHWYYQSIHAYPDISTNFKFLVLPTSGSENHIWLIDILDRIPTLSRHDTTRHDGRDTRHDTWMMYPYASCLLHVGRCCEYIQHLPGIYIHVIAPA